MQYDDEDLIFHSTYAFVLTITWAILGEILRFQISAYVATTKYEQTKVVRFQSDTDVVHHAHQMTK